MPALTEREAPVAGLTLVIPFCNRERLLPRTLDSLARSTRWPKRVLLVDNASTDNSPRLCHQFIRQHPTRSIHLLSELQPGAPAARNRGLAECGTTFVYFFDSDDELSPTFFDDIAPYLTDAVDLVAVPTRTETDGRLHTRVYRPTADPVDQILLSHLNTQAMLLRTQFLRKCGAWNTDCPVWNDWELALRLLLAQPRTQWVTRRPYHILHQHPDSLTGTGRAARIDDILQTLRCAHDSLRAAPKEARYALYLRHSILAGQCLKEGDPTAAGKCDAQTRALFHRQPHKFLRAYTAMGGRAAWLAARALTAFLR